MLYLIEAKHVRNRSNNEKEGLVHSAVLASVCFSMFKVSPNVVAYVELKASNGLHLASQLVSQEEIW